MLQALNGLIIIALFLWLGEVSHRLWLTTVPGPVIGLAAMLVLLVAWPSPLPGVQRGAQWLLAWLSLFFVPAATGIWFSADALSGQALAFLAACIPATLLAQFIIASLLKRFISDSSA